MGNGVSSVEMGAENKLVLRFRPTEQGVSFWGSADSHLQCLDQRFRCAAMPS